MQVRRVVLFAGATAVGIAAGWGLRQFDVPLAWVLGPLVVSAVFVIGGTGFQPLPGGRKAAQVLIGAAVGTQFTPVVAARAAEWLPFAIAAAFAAILVTAVWSVAFRRLARIDAATAYFATLPGGLAEMASLGRRHGAQDEPIAAVQTLRVTLLVLVLPFVMVHVAPGGDPVGLLSRLPVEPVGLVVLLLACAAGGFLARALRINNPWMIGAVGVSIALSAAGLSLSGMPRELLILAQILIGTALGARFRRESLVALPRIAFAGALIIVLATATIAAFAVCVAPWMGLHPATAVLAMAPGGTAEMVLLAGVLGLDPVLVAAFQLVRVVCVNVFAAGAYSGWHGLLGWRRRRT